MAAPVFKPQAYCPTEEDAAALVVLLMERGYFCAGDNNGSNQGLVATGKTKPTTSCTINSTILGEYPCEDTPELRDQIERDRDGNNATTSDWTSHLPKSQLVLTTDHQSYMTRTVLATKLSDLLNDMGGRLSISLAADLLRVTEADVRQIVETILPSAANSTTAVAVAVADCLHNHIVVAGSHFILIPLYFDRLIPILRQTLNQKGGFILLSELAAVHRIPLDLVYQQIIVRLEALDSVIVGDALLWTRQYEQYERARIRGTCCALVAPTQLVDLLGSRDTGEYWSTVVEDMITTQLLAVGSTLHSAMFVPGIHTKLLRRHVDTQFETQGFVTLESCKAMGIGNVAEYVQASFVSTYSSRIIIVMDSFC